MDVGPWIIGAGIALLVGTFLVLIRAFAGPTVYDRLLAVNMIGTKTVLLVTMLGFLTGVANRSFYVDIALMYALINFITTIAILKFIEYRQLD